MAHFDYARPDGLWPVTHVLTPGDVRTWDDAQAKSINGADGGVWSPVKPVVLGGAGLHLVGGGHTLEGGLSTRSGGRLVHGDNDYSNFGGVPRSRGIVWPLLSPQLPDGLGQTAWAPSFAPFGLRTVAAPATTLFLPIPKRYLHNGATLASVVLTFYVGQQHTAIPATLPLFDVYRIGLGASLATQNWLKGTGATPVPAVLPTPADANAYFAGGMAQQITGAMNQFNVIDTDSFAYYVFIDDEAGSGTLPGNVYTSMAFSFTGIADNHFE